MLRQPDATGYCLALILLCLCVCCDQAPTSSLCCVKKTVGGVPYTLVKEADTSNYNCLMNCVYERDDAPGGTKFCFQEGNFEVFCNEGGNTGLPNITNTLNITAVGILIAGGVGARTSTEIYLPSSGKSCALGDLPDERWAHTLDTVSNTAVLCGGGDTDTEETSCLQFSQDTGTWSSYATTLERRRVHSSWVTPDDKLVLMGGWYSPTTTEIVNSGMNFTLRDRTRFACSIQLGSYTIITGGYNTLFTVSKYNLQGWVEDLPSLLEGRQRHACGSFQDGGNKILVVAGGIGSTTERHILGVDSVWTYGQALPRALYDMASLSMDQAVIILGGGDSDYQDRSEILSYDGVRDEWTQLGQMGITRSGAAATKIFVDPAVCG